MQRWWFLGSAWEQANVVMVQEAAIGLRVTEQIVIKGNFSQTRVRLMQNPIFTSWGCRKAGGDQNPPSFFRLFKGTYLLLFAEANIYHINVTSRHYCPRHLFGWANESGLRSLWRCLVLLTAGGSKLVDQGDIIPHGSQLPHFLASHIHKSRPAILLGSPLVLKVKETFPFNCFDTMWPFSSKAFQAHPFASQNHGLAADRHFCGMFWHFLCTEQHTSK